MTRAEILEAARAAVTGERTTQYGGAEDNFGLIAQFWDLYLDHRPFTDLTAVDVAAMMCLFKIARNTTGEGAVDNWVDLAGYAACGGELFERLQGTRKEGT